MYSMQRGLATRKLSVRLSVRLSNAWFLKKKLRKLVRHVLIQ